MRNLLTSKKFSSLIYLILGLLLGATLLVALSVLYLTTEDTDQSNEQNDPLIHLSNVDEYKVETFVVSVKGDEVVTSDYVVIKIPDGSIDSEEDSVILKVQALVNPVDLVVGSSACDVISKREKFGQISISIVGTNGEVGLLDGKSIGVMWPGGEVETFSVVHTGNDNMWEEANETNSIEWGLEQENDTSSVLRSSRYHGDIKAGEKLFSDNCSSCHQMNKRTTGPALSGVTKRLDETWLVPWIRNSQKVIDGGDVYANKIYDEYGSRMTSFDWMTEGEIENILTYLDNLGQVAEDTSQVLKYGSYYPPFYVDELNSAYVLAHEYEVGERVKFHMKLSSELFEEGQLRVVAYTRNFERYELAGWDDGVMFGSDRLSLGKDGVLSLDTNLGSRETDVFVLHQHKGVSKISHTKWLGNKEGAVEVDLQKTDGEALIDRLNKAFPVWVSI